MSQRWYTKEHEWVDVDGAMATIGITDYAQRQLGEIVYVELPVVDAELKGGAVLGSIESVKTAADIYAPFPLTVTEVNDALLDAPEELNQDADHTWICRVSITDAAAIDRLLDREAYNAVLAETDS